LTVRTVVIYPAPSLRTQATAVTIFDASLRTLAADLLDTLRSVAGIGITGPHIGVSKRVVVLDLPDVGAQRDTDSDRDTASGDHSKVYVNPEIVWSSDAKITHEEGSISMSGVTAQIVRAAAVRVRYVDLDGREQFEEADVFRSVCHQQEIDQLNGLFWLQRLSPLKRDRLITRFAKLTA
jgi:peptide deformylase